MSVATVPAPGSIRATHQPGGRRTPLARRVTPYLLLLPTILTIGLLLGYPVWLLLRMSFQRYNLRELIARQGVDVGFENYRTLIDDPFFLTVVRRTVGLMAVCVIATMVLGTLLGLLLTRLGRRTRAVLSLSLVLAWAMPFIAATTVWQWMFDDRYGVANWFVGTVDSSFVRHNWFATPLSTFGIIAAIIVWQSLPFVALSVHAGLLAVPAELYEAARVDGAGWWRTWWLVSYPLIRPILLIITFLQCIWDFKVFAQVYAVNQGGPDQGTITLSVYSFLLGIGRNRFGIASASSVIMIVMMLAALGYYIRRILTAEEL